MSARISGPPQWTTMRWLFPVPFRKFTPFLLEMNARYGNVFAFSVPWRKYVFINEPALIKDVFVTQQQAFTKSLGARSLRFLLGDGLLTSEEPKHRQMRRIVQPAFHRERIANYAETMERAAGEFVAGLRPQSVFDVYAAMTALTLRIATTTLFGSDESASTREVSVALGLMMEEFPHVLVPLGHLRQRLPLPSTKRFHQARAQLDAIIYGLIARRRTDGRDTGDALSMLLAARDADTGYRPTDEEIRDEVMTLFMAGHETTANLLTWTFYLLAQNREIDERLGAAVAAGDDAYVGRVIREGLRLYPPAWLVGRESQQRVTLVDGTIVPPKTTVLFAPLLLHRRAEFFADPQRFDPDRWLNWEPPPFAFFPFGGGARRCIGDEFALREAEIVVAAIARRYSLVKDPAVEVGTAPMVTLRPAGPVPMRPVARSVSPAAV
jgi:cytochrome P450